MKSLAMSALTFYKEFCFQQLAEKLRKAILSQISKDRNGEFVNWGDLKDCILVFV